jgi:hypothetical protein
MSDDEKDTTMEEMDASIMKALREAETAFDDRMEKDGWDVWVVVDLKAISLASDGTPLKQFEIKNSIQGDRGV